MKKQNCEEELKKWLMFIEDPYGEEVRKMSEEKEEIKEALEALDEINNDEEMAELAEAREKYLRDRQAEMDTAMNKRVKRTAK